MAYPTISAPLAGIRLVDRKVSSDALAVTDADVNTDQPDSEHRAAKAHGRVNCRQLIIETACSIAESESVTAVTLGAVAKRAHISKGGLLYHFNTKEQLLSAVIEAWMDRFEERVTELCRKDTRAGSWTRAYLQSMIESVSGKDNPPGRVGKALILAASHDPVLLQPLRQKIELWNKGLAEDGIDPALAASVRLAADGLWMNAMFGLGGLSAQMVECVERYLQDLTHHRRED